MSTITPTLAALNNEIITILCKQTGGVTTADLLAALQTAHPTVGWTEALLLSILTYGKKKGLYILANEVGSTTSGWNLNPAAMYVNTWNSNFAGSCWKFYTPSCCAPSAAVGQTTFYGGTSNY